MTTAQINNLRPGDSIAFHGLTDILGEVVEVFDHYIRIQWPHGKYEIRKDGYFFWSRCSLTQGR